MKVLNLSGTSLIKSLEVKAANAYDRNRYIQLSFTKQEDIGVLLAMTVTALLVGRAVIIPLSQAEEIARKLSERINIPVNVVREVRIPETERNRYFEKDPVTGTEQVKPDIDPDLVWVPTALKIDSADHYREIIQFLDENQYITTEERAALNPYILTVEEQLAFEGQLSDEVSPAQKDVLESFCDPYIDAIIDACTEIEDSTALAGECTWNNFPESFSRRDLAFSVLIDSMKGLYKSIFYEYFGGLTKECMDSAQILCKIYEGDSQLESTFIRQGQGVPYIEKQREVIFDLIETKLCKKFGPGPLGCSRDPLYLHCKKLFAENAPLQMMNWNGSCTPREAVIESIRKEVASTLADVICNIAKNREA